MPSKFYGLAISFYGKAISCCTLSSTNEGDTAIQNDKTWVEEQNQSTVKNLLQTISEVVQLQFQENQRTSNRDYHLPIEIAWPGDDKTILTLDELITQISKIADGCSINPGTFAATPIDNIFDTKLSKLIKDVTDQETLIAIAAYLGKIFADNTKLTLGERYKEVRFFLFPLQSCNIFSDNVEAIKAFHNAFTNKLEIDYEIDIALGTARTKNPHFFNVVKPIMRERIKAIKT